MVVSTRGTKAFVPKHTSNYNAEAVANAQSIFLPDASTPITTDVSVSIQFWLRKRGHTIQTPMTDVQKKQLKECFELIDTDGSGSLDSKEMFDLFDTMGLEVDRQQIEKLVHELDDDGSGELEFGEFMAIMQQELYDSDPHASVWKDDIYTEEDRQRAKAGKSNQAKSDDPPKKEKKENLMPLNLLAGAYRRKKVLDAVMENSGDMRKRLIASGHELKEKIKKEQKNLDKHVEDKSKSWRHRTQQKKLVADRMGESESIQIDVLNPSSATNTPRDAAGAEGNNDSYKPPAPKQEAEQAPPASPKKQPSMKEPAEGPKKLLKDRKAASMLWKEVQANEQLGQAVGAAIVVKRDLHKREEIRERIEFRTRRKPAFSEEDRKRLADNDKLLKGIQDDEMRSLLLAGVIPRAGIKPQQRPETEGGNPYSRQTFGWNTVSDAGCSRPSTVPTGSFRLTPAKPKQISEALAYRPVPKESEITGWNEALEQEESNESTASPRGLRSRGAQRQSSQGTTRRGSLPPRGPSSRPPTQQSQQSFSRSSQLGSRPCSQGRDLLVRQSSSRDSSMRSNAMMRHRAGHALEEAQAAIDRSESIRGLSRKSAKSRRDGAASSPMGSHGSIRLAPPDSPGTVESAFGADRFQDSPMEEPWVSPWTGRVATPISKTRGLELDARISARKVGRHQPGVPVWKKSNAWLPAGGVITKPVKTLPTDDDRAAMAARHSSLQKGRAKDVNRTNYGRSPIASQSVQSARSSQDPTVMMHPAAVL